MSSADHTTVLCWDPAKALIQRYKVLSPWGASGVEELVSGQICHREVRIQGPLSKPLSLCLHRQAAEALGERICGPPGMFSCSRGLQTMPDHSMPQPWLSNMVQNPERRGII